MRFYDPFVYNREVTRRGLEHDPRFQPHPFVPRRYNDGTRIEDRLRERLEEQRTRNPDAYDPEAWVAQQDYAAIGLFGFRYLDVALVPWDLMELLRRRWPWVVQRELARRILGAGQTGRQAAPGGQAHWLRAPPPLTDEQLDEYTARNPANVDQNEQLPNGPRPRRVRISGGEVFEEAEPEEVRPPPADGVEIPELLYTFNDRQYDAADYNYNNDNEWEPDNQDRGRRRLLRYRMLHFTQPDINIGRYFDSPAAARALMTPEQREVYDQVRLANAIVGRALELGWDPTRDGHIPRDMRSWMLREVMYNRGVEDHERRRAERERRRGLGEQVDSPPPDSPGLPPPLDEFDPTYEQDHPPPLYAAWAPAAPAAAADPAVVQLTPDERARRGLEQALVDHWQVLRSSEFSYWDRNRWERTAFYQIREVDVRKKFADDANFDERLLEPPP